jgi:putative oxidoreductase
MGAGKSFGLLLARIGLAATFFYTGVNNVQHIGETTDKLMQLGYPVPHILAMVAVAAELGGALSVLLGALTPLGCIALILFLLPTTYSFHVPGLLKGDPMQTMNALKNLGMVGGLIALLFAGAGRFSVDGRIMGEKK